MKKYRLGIITLPLAESDDIKAGLIPLSDIIELLNSFSLIHLVIGKIGYDFFKENQNIKAHLIKTNAHRSRLKNIIEFIIVQFKISFKIFKLRQVNCWIFFIGGELFLFPIIISKILNKKVVIILVGSASETLKASNANYLSKIADYVSLINYSLSDKIVIYSDALVKKWKLENYKEKISIARHNLINTKIFHVKKDFILRENVIGFVGRFSTEKGLLNLLESRNEIINSISDVKFLIIGEGPLKERVKNSSNSLVNEKTELIGWLEHDELASYLNEMKLLLIPSYTEGLPNIMLESMACGTPVLANSVGSIPDIIIDGENGFLMDSNNPEIIAKNTIRIIKNSNNEEISKNAYNSVITKFNYVKLIKEWEHLFNDL